MTSLLYKKLIGYPTDGQKPYVSETFLMINGTVLRSQMSLRNHRILESFFNQKVEPSKKLARENKLSRSSKLGLLHQIEESEKNMYVGNHLDPRLADPNTARSKLRQRPSFAKDNRFSSHFGRANHLQWNINEGRTDRRSPLNVLNSDNIPVHQLNHRPPEHLNHGLRLTTSASKFDKNLKHKRHKVIKRVRRGQLEDQIDSIKQEVKSTTIFTFKETTTDKSKTTFEFDDHYPDIVKLNISTQRPENPRTVVKPPEEIISIFEIPSSSPESDMLTQAIVEVGNRSDDSYSKKNKVEQNPLLRKALDPGHFSRTMQEAEVIDVGSNEPYKVNVSDGSWHKPLGQFLDKAVQNEVEQNSATQPNAKLTQLEIIKLLEDAYKKSTEQTNYTEETSTTRVSEHRTTTPAVEKVEGNKDLIPPVHPKKIIKESVKTSSSNNSKIKTNVDDMFETKVNEEVRAVEPNKDIQTLFAHVIRIIKIDCLKPKLKAACTDLLTKIGHLMKQYEGKEYLPELGSWNPSLLRPDDKEEAGGKETDVFPPPITRPRPRPRPHPHPHPHKGHETGTYVPNYAEMLNTEPSKICSQRSESKTPYASGEAGCKKPYKSPLKKMTERITGKSSAKDAQKAPLLDEDIELPKPLWLQDLYQPLDSVRKKSMGHGSHYKDSSEEEEVFSRANVSGRSDARNP
ncbi:uncharacterized protein LOC122539990 isoform X2 [Chiloscyllium plagiosum]|uniref:uncharacterized protein LOC122539990 isoform X2 n=1 Tax=Chiloscyllium plagiosum TaxID=36176 RepID=UPI001CB88637|nr:uncharacterized protein LOC122539990 isoform X2 [Chiloscyllium plagiosum]